MLFTDRRGSKPTMTDIRSVTPHQLDPTQIPRSWADMLPPPPKLGAIPENTDIGRPSVRPAAVASRKNAFGAGSAAISSGGMAFGAPISRRPTGTFHSEPVNRAIHFERAGRTKSATPRIWE